MARTKLQMTAAKMPDVLTKPVHRANTDKHPGTTVSRAAIAKKRKKKRTVEGGGAAAAAAAGAETEGDAKEKRPRRYRPGTVALRQIRRYQKSTELLLPKAAFERVVREVAQDLDVDMRFASSAMEALQSAAEAAIVERFAKSHLITVRNGRTTLTAADMQLAGDILKP